MSPPPCLQNRSALHRNRQDFLPLNDNCLSQGMPMATREKCLALFTELLRGVVLKSNTQKVNFDER